MYQASYKYILQVNVSNNTIQCELEFKLLSRFKMAAIYFRSIKSFPDNPGQTLCQNKPKLGTKLKLN